MQGKLQYQLNTNELFRLCVERGWGTEELSEESQLTSNQIWRMTLPLGNRYFSPVGAKSRKALRKVFPSAKGLFLPLNVQDRTPGEVSNG